MHKAAFHVVEILKNSICTRTSSLQIVSIKGGFPSRLKTGLPIRVDCWEGEERAEIVCEHHTRKSKLRRDRAHCGWTLSRRKRSWIPDAWFEDPICDEAAGGSGGVQTWKLGDGSSVYLGPPGGQPPFNILYRYRHSWPKICSIYPAIETDTAG
jgi:hypothetical protein